MCMLPFLSLFALTIASRRLLRGAVSRNLFRGTSLRAVAALTQFQRIFLAFEAGAGKRGAAVVVLLHDSGRVLCRCGEFHYFRRDFGNHILALDDADLDRTGAIPLELVVTGLQFRSEERRVG